MKNLMLVLEKKVPVWRYFFISNGKLTWINCNGCESENDAKNYVRKNMLSHQDKFLVRNISRNMFEYGSSSYSRRKYRGQSVNHITLQMLKRHINEINEVWGDYDIRHLTEHQVINYLIGRDRSESWKNEFLSALREIYREASWQDLHVTMPMFQNFKRKCKKRDCFTQDEIVRFLKPYNFSDHQHYLFFLLCYTAGLRLGEIRGAKVKQIVIDKSAFIVDGYLANDETRTHYNKKGSDEKPKYRVVIIPSFVLKELIAYIKDRGLSYDDYLFTYNGKPFSKCASEYQFKKSLGLSGIDIKGRTLVPHSLRYTYVTMMRYKFKPEIVQRFVGHNSIEMTEYYTRANLMDSINNLLPLLPEINEVFDRQ